MTIEKWSKETGEVAIIMGSHEYADLWETLKNWSCEHQGGDGTCSPNGYRTVMKIVNTLWGDIK